HDSRLLRPGRRSRGFKPRPPTVQYQVRGGLVRSAGRAPELVTDPVGRLLWISQTMPGSVHDLIAARG
ncbi:hypothetical protein AB4212_51350, partial [Streptomyces sp. 2MCAF27]